MSSGFGRHLRKNMTEAEQKLWYGLRGRQVAGVKFRRQAKIGVYYADFVCFECKLVLEVDGGQHAVTSAQDEKRTAWLVTQGFAVLRFWNHEVLGDLEAVLERIYRVVIERVTPSPGASPPP